MPRIRSIVAGSTLLPGLASVTVTFAAPKAGEFPFYCEFHKPWMGGELVALPTR